MLTNNNKDRRVHWSKEVLTQTSYTYFPCFLFTSIKLAVGKGFVIFKPSITCSICLLALFVSYGGYKSYYLKLIGQKNQLSMYHCQVFRKQPLGFETPLSLEYLLFEDNLQLYNLIDLRIIITFIFTGMSGTSSYTPAPPPQTSKSQGGATAPGQPHPAHFTQGSLIQLADGRLKRVENLVTEDFLRSAESSPDVRIDNSCVVRMEPGAGGSDSPTVLITFSVGGGGSGENDANVSRVQVCWHFIFLISLCIWW